MRESSWVFKILIAPPLLWPNNDIELISILSINSSLVITQLITSFKSSNSIEKLFSANDFKSLKSIGWFIVVPLYEKLNFTNTKLLFAKVSEILLNGPQSLKPLKPCEKITTFFLRLFFLNLISMRISFFYFQK